MDYGVRVLEPLRPGRGVVRDGDGGGGAELAGALGVFIHVRGRDVNPVAEGDAATMSQLLSEMDIPGLFAVFSKNGAVIYE